MGSTDTSRSINFALIGHAGDGKTTLADSLLLAAGVINRLGRVDDGTSFMNWLPEEKHRRASVSTSVCSFRWDEAEFTVLDAPGDANFAGEMRCAIAAADNAVLVLNAQDGVRVGTERACTALTSPRPRARAVSAATKSSSASRVLRQRCAGTHLIAASTRASSGR